MKKTLWITLLAICAAVSLYGQEITGTITGSVLDATGAGVPGASITVTNTDRNAVIRTAVTDSLGNYVAPQLPVGHYSVTAELGGFKKAISKNIELNVNDNLTINLSLQVGDITSEVAVEANPIQVELQSAVTGTLILGDQIRELSLNARNYEQLVALMPGVTYTGTTDQIYVGSQNPFTGVSNSISFSVGGGRTDQNSWTIDGVDNVDSTARSSAGTPPAPSTSSRGAAPAHFMEMHMSSGGTMYWPRTTSSITRAL